MPSGLRCATIPRMSNPYSQFAPETFQPQAPPPNCSAFKPWQIVLLAVGGGGLAMLVACGGLLYVGVTGISNREPTDAEREVVVSAADLEPYGAEPSRLAEREVWNAKRNLDGTLEIEYEYDQDRARGNDDTLAVLSTVELHGSDSSARESFGMLIAAYQIGFGVSGVQSRQQQHQMAGVDQSHFSLILNDSQNPVGNMVVVRSGKRVHGLLVIGVYFDDPATLEAVLRPTIERSATLSAP